jgi:hypothetical protein
MVDANFGTNTAIYATRASTTPDKVYMFLRDYILKRLVLLDTVEVSPVILIRRTARVEVVRLAKCPWRNHRRARLLNLRHPRLILIDRISCSDRYQAPSLTR